MKLGGLISAIENAGITILSIDYDGFNLDFTTVPQDDERAREVAKQYFDEHPELLEG